MIILPILICEYFDIRRGVSNSEDSFLIVTQNRLGANEFSFCTSFSFGCPHQESLKAFGAHPLNERTCD
jgi:hypothetical protein